MYLSKPLFDADYKLVVDYCRLISGRNLISLASSCSRSDSKACFFASSSKHIPIGKRLTKLLFFLPLGHAVNRGFHRVVGGLSVDLLVDGRDLLHYIVWLVELRPRTDREEQLGARVEIQSFFRH